MVFGGWALERLLVGYEVESGVPGTARVALQEEESRLGWSTDSVL